ncbi:MAG: aminoacyl-tRNA hydrolase [Candidatus Brennerbacteria bacterium]
MASEFKLETIKLVVGLGNPGAKYARTYHNAGRLVVVTIAGIPETKFKSSTHFLFHKSPHCVFAVLRTFMNESGPAIKSALRTLRVKPKEIVLVHDDTDLPLGSYRLVWARGAAGHHGVKSTIQALGTDEFWRLRIGIRPPSQPHTKADAFVLRQMSKTAEAAVLTIAEMFRELLSPRM